jgi:hypothetical protein
MSSSHDREHLDDLLDQSAPPSPTITNSVTDEVMRLHVLTREEAERTSRRNRWSRPAIAGALALMLVGGATTAVATGWRRGPAAHVSDCDLLEACSTFSWTRGSPEQSGRGWLPGHSGAGMVASLRPLR